MKAVKITLTVLFWAVLTNAVRSGDYPLPRVLPFCAGYKPGPYDLAGLLVIALFLRLLLSRPGDG